MSELSENEAGPGLPREKRLEIIRDAMRKGKTQAEMARLCKVTERTIIRDLRAWRESGGFEEWLEAEFMELHQQVKVMDPKVAYREISTLKGKTIKQKLEAEVSGEQKFIIKMYDPAKDRRDGEKAPGDGS